MTRTFLGITGASGHAYGLRLLSALLQRGRDVDLSVTGAGKKVLRHELGLTVSDHPQELRLELLERCGPAHELSGDLRVFDAEAVEAPPSSGTSLTGGVVLSPCSMGTLARVAAGFSSNLVERAADVALKERRRLVLVPRETPLSEIHLENMLRLTRMGAIILPAMPGFYHRPETLEDAVEHVVGKVLDALGVEHEVGARWKGLDEPQPEQGTTPLPPPGGGE